MLSRSAIGAAIGLYAAQAGAFELAQPPTFYAPCTAASLAGFPWIHRAFGHAVPGIALRNISLHACRVAGFAGVRAYQADGTRANVRIGRTMFIDTKVFAYTLTPGSAVFFALYGRAPNGEFDRSCVGISQFDVRMPGDRRPIDVVVASGTCGGRLTQSQMFPVSELSR